MVFSDHTNYFCTIQLQTLGSMPQDGTRGQNLGHPNFCGLPWSAAYINFNQNIHQIQVLTKPLCRAQAIFNSLPNNEWGTKYGFTYSAK